MFDRAVLLREMTSARGYLTPSLAAATPPVQLASLLGLQAIPRTAHYSIVRVTSRRAVSHVTYASASGVVRDIVTLTRANGTWRISAIQPG